MTRFLVLLLMGAALAACEATVRGPSAEISAPRISIGGGHGFCPPGQAKKGNC